MKTREERQRCRRENVLLAICTIIIGLWVAALLLTCSANAAYTKTAVEQLDPLTEALAVIGAYWVAWTLLRGIEWMDKRKK